LLNSRSKEINKILHSRAVPEEGLDELTIESLLDTIAAMDSNNGLSHIGIGEREGRVYSNIVKRRKFNLVHGMGRYIFKINLDQEM
jgi:O-phospho-L-seryl-tRNASec:L-selenocysteinyl-tRNA synthase